MSILKAIYAIGLSVAIGWCIYLQHQNYELLNGVDERVKMVQMGQNSQFAIALVQGTFLTKLYHSIDHTHLSENQEALKEDEVKIEKLLRSAASDPSVPFEK